MAEPVATPLIQPDPTDAQFAADPEAVYGPIRARAPVWWWEEARGWLVTGHAPFVEASRHDDLVIDCRLWEHYEAPTDPIALAMEDRLDEALPMMADGPHDRVRGLLGKAFTPRAVARLEPSIREILGELIEGLRPKGRFDLVAALANWYPIRVISRMFGIPPNSEREARFKQYADVFVRSVNPFLAAEERARSARVQLKFFELVAEVVEEHRTNSRDDILSGLIAAEEDGDRLSTPELLNLVLGLIMAGTETTASAVAVGMFELLRHPAQLAAGGTSTQAGVPATEIEAVPHGHSGLQELVLPAGSAVIFNDSVLHGSMQRTNPGQRRTLVFRYLPSAYGYRWNYQPSEALLDRLTPHQRLLITANKGVPTNSPAGNNFAQLAKAAAGEDPSTAGATGGAKPRL